MLAVKELILNYWRIGIPYQPNLLPPPRLTMPNEAAATDSVDKEYHFIANNAAGPWTTLTAFPHGMETRA